MNALQTIQQKLKAPKNQWNNFGGYNYRNQEDILEAVKPFLAETNSELTLSDEIVEIGGKLFVKATATLVDPTTLTTTTAKSIWAAAAYAMHADQQKGMNEAQITGSASSYARKYALNGLFLIDDTKDADATNDHSDKKKEIPKTTEKKVTDTPKAKELPWLNPGTGNWTYTIKRIQQGVTLAEIKTFFRISEANEKRLIEETKNETSPLPISNTPTV